MSYSIVFPGQGSQKPGMGQDFFEKYKLAQEVFEEASEAIQLDLKELCFTENEKLNLTEFTQPAILTTEIAMLRVLESEFGIKGEYFAGHSLGEYTALVAANVLDLQSAVKIVRKRGALMQSAVPEGVGAMAACIATNIIETNIKDLVTECGAELANLNSKNQVVISGRKEKVEEAAKKVKETIPEVDVVFLNVSAPFHSSLMKPIEKEFHEYLSSFTFKTENCTRVLSNFTGEFHKPESLLTHLTSQISGSVKWIENMTVLISKNLPIIEIGPNKPLAKFFQTLGAEIVSIINLRGLKNLTK